LRVKEHQMLATYKPSSIMLDQVRASMQAAESDLGRSGHAAVKRNSTAPNVVFQNIQTDLLRASAETQASLDSVAVLQTQVMAIDNLVHATEAERTKLNDLQRAVDIDDVAYRALALHLEDARVEENRVRDRLSHGAVINAPSLPYKAARPRYIITAIASLFAGLFTGLAAAIGFEMLDDRFTTVRQLEHHLGLPVLASFGACS
jgi:uncharacterized protein involved in exopolysaccharide biosynthesis